MAVRPPPTTTMGSRSCILAIESVRAAPVSCSAMRKSEAVRTPRASPLGSSSTVGLPAPAASAMWSKPSANARSAVSVPPKRTPPKRANWLRRSTSRRATLRKFLSQRTVMPYSATPPKPAMTRSFSGSRSDSMSRMGPKGTRLPAASTPEIDGSRGSILRPSMPTTVWPSFIRWCAVVNPAGPMPTMRMRLPVAGRGRGRRRWSGFHRVSSE